MKNKLLHPENENVIKWTCRIVILLFLIYFIYAVFFRQKKVNETVIPPGERDLDTSIVQDLINYYKRNCNENKRSARGGKRVNKTENKCRDIIEKCCNAKFPTIRPDFLKSPKTGKNLELDCYNADLKIALEYNGPQHYNYNTYFHKSKNDFYSQVHRDDWKRKKCRELGITLIEVPYWVTEMDLEKFIRGKLRKERPEFMIG